MLMRAGSCYEAFGDVDNAIKSFESALRHNLYNSKVLANLAAMYRKKELWHRVLDSSPLSAHDVRPLTFSLDWSRSMRAMASTGVRLRTHT